MRRIVPALPVLAFLATPQLEAPACPACNIHNYLVNSVGCSENIVVGRLKEDMGDGKIKVEVLRTIRGDYKTGDLVVMESFYRAPKEYDECFVFSDVKHTHPSFEVLPLSFEEEVRFLAGYAAGELGCDSLEFCYAPECRGVERIPVIRDLDEAIRCSMGYSNQSRCLGLEYILALDKHPTQQIIEAIERERNAGPEYSYQARCLLVALLLKPEPQAQEYAEQQVRAFLALKHEDIDWNQIPHHPTTAGEFLTALLGCTRAQWSPAFFAGYQSPQKAPLVALREKGCQLLLEAYPKLNVSAMADVTCALCITGTSRPEALLALVEGSPAQDGFALGLYYLANEKAGCWDWKTAGALFAHASALTTRPELKKRITERLDRSSELGAAATQPASLAEITLFEDHDADEAASGAGMFWDSPATGLVLTVLIPGGGLLVVVLVALRSRAARGQNRPAADE